ncbi:MAG: response regulator [Magnetococcales bacterium]|nr:response regulator [Magnetococcales bacterium]
MPNILVIDDDVQFLAYLHRILTNEGYEVGLASDGRQGQALIDEEKFDLLITDIFMPVKDGIEVLREIRRRKLEIKIICISGGGQNCSPEEALKIVHLLGADRILNKPFTKNDLLPLIRELLAGGESSA